MKKVYTILFTIILSLGLTSCIPTEEYKLSKAKEKSNDLKNQLEIAYGINIKKEDLSDLDFIERTNNEKIRTLQHDLSKLQSVESICNINGITKIWILFKGQMLSDKNEIKYDKLKDDCYVRELYCRDIYCTIYENKYYNIGKKQMEDISNDRSEFGEQRIQDLEMIFYNHMNWYLETLNTVDKISNNIELQNKTESAKKAFN